MRTQILHAAFRELFLTNVALAEIFGGRLANTRLPAGTYRPYATLRIINAGTEIYTGGSINDYILDLKIYTTEGYDARVIQEAVDNIISLMSNFSCDQAKTISCLPINGDDSIADEMDLGSDVLVNELFWAMKLFEPNRLSYGG